MWSEDEMVMISAIEHYSYCPRQCALIHVEQIYQENVFTLRGRQAHERTDTTTWEMVGTTRVERALPLWSERLGLYGRADTVEFQAEEVIYPVEYKHGPRRQHHHDDLQLCAQAACLEEMFGQAVPQGAIYHHTTRRRRVVSFTLEMRAEMEAMVAQIRWLRREGRMPPALNDARCRNCSLLDACVPSALVAGRQAYHARQLYRVETSVAEKDERCGDESSVA
jgi:CRISPR-associated exonuclease Cas4